MLEEVLKIVKEGMHDEVVLLKRELASDREAADKCLLEKLKLEIVSLFKKTHKSIITSTRRYLLR